MQKNSLKLLKNAIQKELNDELNLNTYTEKCNQTDEKIEEITG